MGCFREEQMHLRRELMNPLSINMKHEWKCEVMRYENEMTWGLLSQKDMTANGQCGVTSLE